MTVTELARRSVVAFAVASLCGCMAAAKPAPIAAPLPTGNAPTLRQVLDTLAARDLSLARFRAQARLDYRSPQQSFRSTQMVVVRAPSSARIEVMNPFGVSYTVATDGAQLFAYDRRQGVFYEGKAQPESFRHYIGVPLGAADVAAMLRGVPPALGDKRWNPKVQPTEGGWLCKRGLPGGGTLEFVVATDSLVPLRVKISGDKFRHEVSIAYSDYRDVAGIHVPHHINVRFKDGSQMDVEYKSVQREVALAPDAFRIDRPSGARLVNIDAEAGGGA